MGGLASLPKVWTPPFIVVSDELLSQYIKSTPQAEHVLDRWINQIINGAALVGMEENTPIIVRSSGTSEGLEERGKYYSSEGVLRDIVTPLNYCLRKLSSDDELRHNKIFLVIQKHIFAISLRGHLSNERRCYEETRDWLGQYDDIKTKSVKPFKINIRNWRKRIPTVNYIDKPLICKLSAHVSETLKIPATWAYEQQLRLHFEWVWDGEQIYLVQADQEVVSNGDDPTIIGNQRKNSILANFEPECLEAITHEHASRYSKVRNVLTYLTLGLPITKLYILDDQALIDDLAQGKIPDSLERDLHELVKGSLVIRIDIATSDEGCRQLLPRTNEVRELNDAIRWLKERSAELKESGIKDPIAFIFHNFVPSVSSAFAYAAPDERKVQIEALWGLPEGLYYNSHDKYIVDTLKPNLTELTDSEINLFEVVEKRNFKRFFVTPDDNGRWNTMVLKAPYDWRGSIKLKKWVKQIALESRRIAEEEQKPLSIMWFVGVPREFCKTPILPWYHEPYDPRIINRTQTHRTKTPFDKSLIIKTSKDIEKLKIEAAAQFSSVRRIRIQPLEERLLRDKNTLQMIGELAQKIDAIILLEGGVLSHAYYQLMQTNATVEVKHPFNDYEDKREFNKLVRDEVAANIERGGEVVSKTCLSGEFYLQALREKLVEESFEVLDALDQDSIVEELADVTEIIDSILHRLGVKRSLLKQRQLQKRNRAGGFKNGLVLLQTRNPLPTKKGKFSSAPLFEMLGPPDTKMDINKIEDRKVIELGHTIDKWSDRREHQAAAEVILSLIVPVVRDSWLVNTPETMIGSTTDNTVQAKIIGMRFGSKIQIELSFFIPREQLKLF